jgi:anti-sigma B factor antagonist
LIVCLAGELDLAATDALPAALQEAGPADAIVLDLGQLDFVDSAGLRVLYDLWQASTDNGFDFTIVGASRHVLKVLNLTGLDKVLPIASAGGIEPA